MDQVPIPDDIRRFILIGVPSVPYLEAMLLLRASADQAWQCEMLAKRLYITNKAAADLLAQLHAAGMLNLVNGETLAYRYCPVSDDLRRIIDGVADVHAKNLVGVTHLIHSKTDKKAHRLADAFVWRKDT